MYLILVLILLYSMSRFFDMSFLSACDHGEWYQYFTFQLVHTSFLHLLVNVIVIYLYWRVIKKNTIGWISILIVATSSTLSGYLGADLPTIGASSIAFALVGIYLVWIWGTLPKKDTLKFYAITALFIAIPPVINHNLAFMVHIYALAISVSLSLILRNILYVRHK